MSRSGVFYAIKAMERVAAGTTGADAPRVAAGRAVAHDAPAVVRPDGGASAVVQRARAAMRYCLGGARGRAGWGLRRRGRAARAD